MRKYIVEFLGTFFLVLTVGMAVMGGASNFAPLAIGGILVALVYAGGYISGAHYNPAVTLAVWMRGKISQKEARAYVGIQVLAAVIAGIIVLILLPSARSVDPSGLASTARGFLAELLGTFVLAFVVLQTATAKITSGNSYYGVAIGITVMAMAYVFGSVSGGAFNPAVALGASVMHMATWGSLWVYIVACFAGGGLAAIVFRMINPDDR